MVSYTRRLDRPLHYEVGPEAICDPLSADFQLGSIPLLAQWYTNHLENLVRRSPGQYWWLHRRWKGQPPRPQTSGVRSALRSRVITESSRLTVVAHRQPSGSARRTYPPYRRVHYDSGFDDCKPLPLLSARPCISSGTFRNSDPPRLAEIWRDQPPQRGLIQPVSPALLEQFVFSKPYFDPAGLILATDGEQAVGFVHAGFGPNETQTEIDTEIGTTYQLMLRSGARHDALADELLSRAEAYLRDRGAKVIYAGGIRPLNGFYLGLYGGSELPGVLASDPVFNAVTRAERLPRNR